MTFTFDPETVLRITCDIRYFCANFSVATPLFSRLRPDARDIRQTVRCQIALSLNTWITPVQQNRQYSANFLASRETKLTNSKM